MSDLLLKCREHRVLKGNSPFLWVFLSHIHLQAELKKNRREHYCQTWSQWKPPTQKHRSARVHKNTRRCLQLMCWQLMTHWQIRRHPASPPHSPVLSICHGHCSHGWRQRPQPTCHSLFASSWVNTLVIRRVGFALTWRPLICLHGLDKDGLHVHLCKNLPTHTITAVMINGINGWLFTYTLIDDLHSGFDKLRNTLVMMIRSNCLHI